MGSQINSDDDVIAAAKEYLAKTNMPTQHKLRSATGTSTERLKRLADAGHFTMPAKVPKSLNRLYRPRSIYDKFRLPGSPSS